MIKRNTCSVLTSPTEAKGSYLQIRLVLGRQRHECDANTDPWYYQQDLE